MQRRWIKKNKDDIVSWDVADNEEPMFRFDDEPEKEYFLHGGYVKLPKERKAIFDKENPYWAEFFNGSYEAEK